MTPDAQSTRSAPWLHRAAWGLLVGALGCRTVACWGPSLSAEVDGQRFVRCAQAEPPSPRSLRVGSLQVTVAERVLRIEGARELRIAAFTGPVGAALEREDLAQLEREKPDLILYLGGLGDTETIARANLAQLGALHVPTVFVAGGADRMPVLEAAFAALGEGERDTLFHGSGLRELRIGPDRFVVVAGAPFGRYALDDESCGLTSDDFEQIQRAAQEPGDPTGATRTWLLSWHASAEAGVAEGFDHSELGSPDLKALGTALGAVGGVFAYPEAQPDAARAPRMWLAPRLSRVGTLRVDGSRLRSQVLSLVLSAKGLVPAP